RDVAVTGVQTCALPISLLRYRHGDDRGAGIAEAAAHFARTLAGDQELADRADDAQRRVRIELHQRIEAVLRRQRSTERGCLERDRADGARCIPLEQPVEIERLVRAVECARPEVHRADAGLRAVIAGPQQLRRCTIQGTLAEASGACWAGVGHRGTVSTQSVTPVFQMASSRSPLSSARVG